MKKIMLRTSDAWSTSHLSQQPSKPAYHIVDCRILGLKGLQGSGGPKGQRSIFEYTLYIVYPCFC